MDELHNLLQSFSINSDAPDEWRWGGCSSGVFSVKAAFLYLSQRFHSPNNHLQPWEGFKLLWKSYAPIKAQLTTWRIVRDRLPMRYNLCKCFVLSPEESLCYSYKQVLEMAEHFFLNCSMAQQIWSKIYDWVGVPWAPAGEINSHFLHFSNLLSGDKFRKRLSGLWICVVWVL